MNRKSRPDLLPALQDEVLLENIRPRFVRSRIEDLANGQFARGRKRDT